MNIPSGFKGRAKRLDDVDLPKIGKLIGVGEDEIHAVIDIESRGGGFDKHGRPKILFEPHVFYRNLTGKKRDNAVSRGLAYRKWRRNYPADSYPRLLRAMRIDRSAAFKACSWGMGQVLGENYRALNYPSPAAMVAAFCDDEETHLQGMIDFIITNHLDDELRRHDWAGFARGYNGPGYRKNDYHNKLARAFAKWQRIKDTAIDAPQAPIPDHVPITPKPAKPATKPAVTSSNSPKGEKTMESKWIGTSLTFWGVVVTFLSTVLPVVGPMIGFDITADQVADVGTSVTTVIQAVGGITGTVMAIIGRMRAKGPATLVGT